MKKNELCRLAERMTAIVILTLACVGACHIIDCAVEGCRKASSCEATVERVGLFSDSIPLSGNHDAIDSCNVILNP